MKFLTCDKRSFSDIADLFKRTFSASEGEEEGELIYQLVKDLLTLPDDHSIVCYQAVEEGQCIAAVIFSKLTYSEVCSGLLLSPMAVTPDAQGKGVGQNLIRFAIEQLKEGPYPFVMTYGDPKFYSKVGFESVSEKQLAAPYRLSMPQGWLALSLDGKDLPMSTIKPQCVEPFHNPDIW